MSCSQIYTTQLHTCHVSSAEELFSDLHYTATYLPCQQRWGAVHRSTLHSYIPAVSAALRSCSQIYTTQLHTFRVSSTEELDTDLHYTATYLPCQQHWGAGHRSTLHSYIPSVSAAMRSCSQIYTTQLHTCPVSSAEELFRSTWHNYIPSVSATMSCSQIYTTQLHTCPVSSAEELFRSTWHNYIPALSAALRSCSQIYTTQLHTCPVSSNEELDTDLHYTTTYLPCQQQWGAVHRARPRTPFYPDPGRG